MVKKRSYIIVGIIFILAFLAGNFVYPSPFQRLGVYPQFLPERDFKLGLDLEGGTHLVYQADLSQIKEKEKSETMEGLRDVIERRVNLFGVREPLVQVQGERLIVELAGIIDPAEAIREIGKTPFLEFREERPAEEVEKIKRAKEEVSKKAEELKKEGKTEKEILEELTKLENWPLSLQDIFTSTPLTGRYLKKAELGFEPTTNQPIVLLEFNEEGAKIFEELTERNIGKQLAIYIDGLPISAPVVQEKISGGKAQITGKFTIEEAKTLARNLNAGALPVPISLISQQSVGPTLGKISLEKSLKAGVIGFLAIIFFMTLFYRLPGLLASLALAIYIVLVLTLFKLIPVTLTLAGIAGFILSIGMAVDANILIFSRMREELREGKSLASSIEEGFRRAWPSIRDANLTTLIVAAILFAFGSSFVKGFATTLSIGILVSMFSAIFITENFLRCFPATGFEKFKFLWL